MKKILLVFSILALLGCKNTQKKEDRLEGKVITVQLEPKSGSEVTGVVTFTQNKNNVTMVLRARGLTPGMHAVHLHEKADCSAEDGSSTGGHWNPTHAPHGKWGSEAGYHRGDIGNIQADKNGIAKLIFSTDQWCIGCQDQTKDIVGKAVIIHQGEDDFKTQPTGNAGGRVSCAGIIK